MRSPRRRRKSQRRAGDSPVQPPLPVGLRQKVAPHLRAGGSRTAAENRYLSFTIAADGGLDVTDKETGQDYRGLGHFYDVEDAGDEYSYSPCRAEPTW